MITFPQKKKKTNMGEGNATLYSSMNWVGDLNVLKCLIATLPFEEKKELVDGLLSLQPTTDIFERNEWVYWTYKQVTGGPICGPLYPELTTPQDIENRKLLAHICNGISLLIKAKESERAQFKKELLAPVSARVKNILKTLFSSHERQ